MNNIQASISFCTVFQVPDTIEGARFLGGSRKQNLPISGSYSRLVSRIEAITWIHCLHTSSKVPDMIPNLMRIGLYNCQHDFAVYLRHMILQPCSEHGTMTLGTIRAPIIPKSILWPLGMGP